MSPLLPCSCLLSMPSSCFLGLKMLSGAEKLQWFGKARVCTGASVQLWGCFTGPSPQSQQTTLVVKQTELKDSSETAAACFKHALIRLVSRIPGEGAFCSWRALPLEGFKPQERVKWLFALTAQVSAPHAFTSQEPAGSRGLTGYKKKKKKKASTLPPSSLVSYFCA